MIFKLLTTCAWPLNSVDAEYQQINANLLDIYAPPRHRGRATYFHCFTTVKSILNSAWQWTTGIFTMALRAIVGLETQARCIESSDTVIKYGTIIKYGIRSYRLDGKKESSTFDSEMYYSNRIEWFYLISILLIFTCAVFTYYVFSAAFEYPNKHAYLLDCVMQKICHFSVKVYLK